MDALPKLGLIACYGTGFEGVDLAAARARDIVVSHAGDTNSTAVAEFAMGLVIASARDLVRGDRYARAGRWRGDIIERLPIEPRPRGAAARHLRAGIDRHQGRTARRRLRDGDRLSQPQAAAGCVLHLSSDTHRACRRGPTSWSWRCAPTPATTTRSMRRSSPRSVPRATSINVSRGIAVDTAALCDALEAGTIGGAGIDVFEDEPNIPERLTRLDNVVLTPHMAAISANAQRAQRDIMFANLEAFFAGRPVLTPVPQ